MLKQVALRATGAVVGDAMMKLRRSDGGGDGADHGSGGPCELGAAERLADEVAQGRAGLDEARGARRLEREHGLRPLHRLGEAARELRARVVHRPRSQRRVDGQRRPAERDAFQHRGEHGGARRHDVAVQRGGGEQVVEVDRQVGGGGARTTQLCV